MKSPESAPEVPAEERKDAGENIKIRSAILCASFLRSFSG